MRWRLEWSADESMPSREGVLRLQGIPPEATVPSRIDSLLHRALEVYRDLADPRAVVELTTGDAFGHLYRGEGRNAADTPLEHIAPKADALALFVATVGARVTTAIARLFARHDLALAAMLDSVASEAADGLARTGGQTWLAIMQGSELVGTDARVLAYSPGYCGWHVTGQRALFQVLRPEEIGVTLNESCLMQPLKSVSGVMVAGAAAIHRFRPTYDFCDACATYECRARMASVLRS